MHPHTRQALLAMLVTIEQQAAAIRGLLAGEGSYAATSPTAPTKQPPQQQSRSYLTDEEDDALATDLGITEVERMAELVQPEQAAVQTLMHQALSGMSQYTTEQQNAAFLRGVMGG